MIRVIPFFSTFLRDKNCMKEIEAYINENGITKNDIIQLLRSDDNGYIILVYEDNKPYIPETESTESESSSPQ